LGIKETTNVLTNGYFQMIRDAFAGTVTDLQIKYLEWGDGTTPALATDTALESPLGRKQVTDRTLVDVDELVTTVYIAPAEGNDPITEWGWYAGVGATATIGTGTLIARVLLADDKTDLESYTLDRTDVWSEAP
jgi:hypothetical protein